MPPILRSAAVLLLLGVLGHARADTPLLTFPALPSASGAGASARMADPPGSTLAALRADPNVHDLRVGRASPAALLGADAVFFDPTPGAGDSVVLDRLSTRRTEPDVVHLDVQMALFGLVPTIIFWRTPTLAHLGWFVVMAAIGAVAHYSLTRAIEHADFTALQPFEFVQLGWAALLGYVFFAEVPANHVLLGGAVVVAATSWMVHHEARRDRPSP